MLRILGQLDPDDASEDWRQGHAHNQHAGQRQDASFLGDKGAEDDKTCEPDPKHLSRSPALRWGLDDRPEQQNPSSDRQDRVGWIGADGRRILRIGHQDQCADEPGEGDRDFDDKHRAPPEVRRQQAARDLTAPVGEDDAAPTST